MILSDKEFAVAIISAAILLYSMGVNLNFLIES